MIEHPSVFRRPRLDEAANTDGGFSAQNSDELFAQPVECMQSPYYWLRARTPEKESAMEQAWESSLETLPVDPDQMQGNLVDVRDYLPVRPRRVSQRLRAPHQLVFAHRPFDFVPMELHVLTQNPARPFIASYLYDVNDHGICLAAPEPLATGTDVWFCAHHREEPTALISLQTTVLNQRPCPIEDPLHELSNADALWLHGLCTPQREARLLLRCTLDSLACREAQQDQEPPLLRQAC